MGEEKEIQDRPSNLAATYGVRGSPSWGHNLAWSVAVARNLCGRATRSTQCRSIWRARQRFAYPRPCRQQQRALKVSSKSAFCLTEAKCERIPCVSVPLANSCVWQRSMAVLRNRRTFLFHSNRLPQSRPTKLWSCPVLMMTPHGISSSSEPYILASA